MFYENYSAAQQVNRCLSAVYGLMACALAITAATAYLVASSPAIYNWIFSSPGVVIGLFIVQIGLVFSLTLFLFRMPYAVALGLFILYSITLGFTLSSIFLLYTQMSIYQTFLVTAGMFGAMCLYGYFTRSDLTKLGAIAGMGLIGLFIALLVNLYFKSETTDLILSGIGVLIFTLLTAYDAQKIKNLAQQLAMQHEPTAKIAILGALTLYLDFINLFLFLLRFMGKRRE